MGTRGEHLIRADRGFSTGGSLIGRAVAPAFARLLDVPQVLLPLGNEDCLMHAANENIRIENVKKGLAFSSRFFGSQ